MGGNRHRSRFLDESSCWVRNPTATPNPIRFPGEPAARADGGPTVGTLLDTGLRVSEWCGLTAKDSLWQQRQLRVKGKGVPRGPKTKVRVVPMSPRVRALLEHHCAWEKAFAVPVPTRRAQDLVKVVANRAGITGDVSPRVPRHTFATTALQKGTSLPTVPRILGHDRLQTTAISLNFTDLHIRDEFERKW